MLAARLISYRLDYRPDAADLNDRPTVVDMGSGPAARRRVMDKARSLSGTRAVSTAYAIATLDGRDTGQRVYCDGRFSYQDGEF